MALFQQDEAGVTSDEAGAAGDEDAPAHDFNRSGVLILNELDCKWLTHAAIELSFRPLHWACEERNGGSEAATRDRS